MPTEAENNGAQQDQGQQGQNAGGTPEPTWDTWLAGLPEADRANVSKLYDAKTSGLKSALDKERETRTENERQIRDLASKATKGSDDEKRLTTMADDLAKATQRADFFEQAAKPEIGVSDVIAAYALVMAMPKDYVDQRGNVNFVLLKERHPTLFQQPIAQANAGAGTGGSQGGAGGSNAAANQAIRGAAGYR